MTPTEHCFAKLREMCLKHDPSLAIALDLVLEDMAGEGSPSGALAPETGQISQDARRNPVSTQWTREGYLFDASAKNGGQETPNERKPEPPATSPSEPVGDCRGGGDPTGRPLDMDPAAGGDERDVPIEAQGDPGVSRVPGSAAGSLTIQEPNDLLAEHTGKVLGHTDQEIKRFLETPAPSEEDEWEIPDKANELPRSERAALCARLRRGGMSYVQIAKKTGIPKGSIYGLVQEHLNRGKTFTPPSKPPSAPEKQAEGEEPPLPGYVAHAHVRKVFDEALARCNGAPRGVDVVRILRMGMERPGAPTKMADELELPATTVATVLNRYKPLLVAWRAFVSPVVRAYFGELVCKHAGLAAPSNP